MPEPPFWGTREIEVDLEEVYPHLDRHVLFKLHWGGRGKKGEEWRKIVEGDGDEEGFQPRLERMWAEQDYLHRARSSATSPATPTATSWWSSTPRTRTEICRLGFPRQPKHDRICLADFYRPLERRACATSWRSRA